MGYESNDGQLVLTPPTYLIGMKHYCWKCESRMSVVAILTSIDEYIAILNNITQMPDDLISYIQGRVPTYKKKYSKTAEGSYFANTCPSCGVITGDFHLHAEPGAPFFPMDANEASALYMTELPISDHVKVDAEYGMGVGEEILKYAKRIE